MTRLSNSFTLTIPYSSDAFAGNRQEMEQTKKEVKAIRSALHRLKNQERQSIEQSIYAIASPPDKPKLSKLQSGASQMIKEQCRAKNKRFIQKKFCSKKGAPKKALLQDIKPLYRLASVLYHPDKLSPTMSNKERQQANKRWQLLTNLYERLGRDRSEQNSSFITLKSQVANQLGNIQVNGKTLSSERIALLLLQYGEVQSPSSAKTQEEEDAELIAEVVIVVIKLFLKWMNGNNK